MKETDPYHISWWDIFSYDIVYSLGMALNVIGLMVLIALVVARLSL